MVLLVIVTAVVVAAAAAAILKVGVPLLIKVVVKELFG